tara:strand:+ start:2169 stop:2669 length:501 start_codon:yes stop_codon:yes gene_type:complete
MQNFTTKFNLSRDYLAECFDQSLPYGKNAKPNYVFPAVLFASGMSLLFFTGEPKLIGSILAALAVLEIFHIWYRRAWWLARQMLGRSADSEVTLIITDTEIRTHSPYAQTTLLWADIERVIETDLGLILVAKSGGQQYLSKSLFSSELTNDIITINQDRDRLTNST